MTCFYSINSLQWITKREKTICVYNKMYNFRFNTLKQINKNISLASITRRKTIGQRFIYFCLLTLHFARALFIFSAVPVLNTVFTSVSLFVPSVFFFLLLFSLITRNITNIEWKIGNGQCKQFRVHWANGIKFNLNFN